METKMKQVKNGFVFLMAAISLCPLISGAQSIVLNDSKAQTSLPSELSENLEGSMGGFKVRMKLSKSDAASDDKMSFEGADMNIYLLEKAEPEILGQLKMIFYQSYPGSDKSLKHKFILDGTVGSDGSYAGDYRELPGGKKGKFALRPAEKDVFSGNYSSPVGWMTVQWSDQKALNFSIGNDWCGMEGQAAIVGKTAHYERLMSGVTIFINFDFSKAPVCAVETNTNSKEAQEQQIASQLGNAFNCVPNFSGDYSLDDLSDGPKGTGAPVTAQASAFTPTPSVEDENDDSYCTNMSDAQKSKRLDRAQGMTFTAPGLDSTVFVYVDKPGPTDHGGTGGHCGVRLDTYRKTSSGGLVHTGRWENLISGFNAKMGDAELPVCPNYLLLEIETDSDDGTSADCERYVFDGSAKVMGQDSYNGWDYDAWVKKDGNDLLWDITVHHIAVKTPDMKNLWIDKAEVQEALSYFSPNLQYASRQFGSDGETMAIYNLEGKCLKKFALPFPMKQYQDETVLGLTDEPEVVFRDKNNLCLIDLNGISKVKAVLPKYPNRKLDTYSGAEKAPGNVFRIFEYDATTNRIKDYPQPAVKVNIETFEAWESLDGEKTWKSIDIKMKTGGK